MTKSKLLFSLTAFIFSLNFFYNAQASKRDLMEVDNNYFNKKVCLATHHFPKNFFISLPNEIIIKIADYLGGDDFKSFYLTSQKIKELVFNSPSFFPNDETLIKKIRETKIENFDRLLYSVGRLPKYMILPKLEKISNQFQEYDCEINKKNISRIKSLYENFENFIKTNNIKWSITNNYSQELQNIYKHQAEYHGQSLLSYDQGGSAFFIPFIIFYGEKLALLCQQDNDEYIGSLKNGWYRVSLLEKNLEKEKAYTRSKKFFKLLNLKS